ncbi:ectoine synthase [Maritalea mediterranea]|uniref:L-ectoine synthase n=1 Tax=Maritalea mediterranea TaxID=2909667 RepID=A0ABS9EBP9_9HYPH|nr:ectoine synthase [Maritalea mediterranea]MCF4099180.1 ectoine synthase [Maritalea mediterranea]
MIVRDLNKARETDRLVSTDGWDSTRLLLADDNMGFSFHVTRIKAGTSHVFHYKHHLEAVFCIEGEGQIKDLATGEVHEIKPGVIYALDKNDKHELSAKSQITFACTFNPPVTGNEVHREDGSYAPAPEVAAE